MPADIQSVLADLKEDSVLPHPVQLRDLILRTKLAADAALEINREFQSYLTYFGESQRIARAILEKLVEQEPKTS